MTTQNLNLDLDIILKRVAKDNPELTASDLERAEAEYRNYLHLARLYPGQSVSPTRLADKVWHTHIIFTKKYATDCADFFGYFLHHNPFDGANPDQGMETVDRTKKLYEMHFGPWPEMTKAFCNGGCDGGGVQPPGKPHNPIPGPAPTHDVSQAASMIEPCRH